MSTSRGIRLIASSSLLPSPDEERLLLASSNRTSPAVVDAATLPVVEDVPTVKALHNLMPTSDGRFVLARGTTGRRAHDPSRAPFATGSLLVPANDLLVLDVRSFRLLRRVRIGDNMGVPVELTDGTVLVPAVDGEKLARVLPRERRILAMLDTRRHAERFIPTRAVVRPDDLLAALTAGAFIYASRRRADSRVLFCDPRAPADRARVILFRELDHPRGAASGPTADTSSSPTTAPRRWSSSTGSGAGEAAPPDGRPSPVAAPAPRAAAAPPGAPPAMPVPDWRQRRVEAPVVEPGDDGVSVTVRSVALTGACPGEGRRAGEGVRLVVTGSATQAPGRLYHRGEVTAALFLRLGPDMALLRASEGVGFDPPVSSDEPWRPGTTRAFRAVTRAVDPIYCEVDALDARAAVHVRTEGPLGDEVDRWVWAAPIAWPAVRGLRVAAEARVAPHVDKPVKLEGPYFAGRVEPGTPIEVLGVSRDRAFVRHVNQLGWLPVDALAWPRPWTEAAREPAPTPAVSWPDGDVVYHLRDLRIAPRAPAADDGPSRELVARVEVASASRSAYRCAARNIRLLMSTGAEVTAEANAAFDDTCASRVKPGQTAVGELRFALPALGDPWAVGLRGGAAAVLAVAGPGSRAEPTP